MPLSSYLQLIRRRWLIMLIPAVVVLAFTLITAGRPVVPPPVYNVGVRFLVAPPLLDPDETAGSRRDEENRYYQWLTSEYVVNALADWVNSINFAERVARRLAAGGVEVNPIALFNGTSAEAIRSRLTITMNYEDAAVLEQAMRAAIDVVLEESGEAIPHLAGEPAAVTVLDRPLVNQVPAPITGQLDLPLRIAISLVTGFLVGLLVDYFDPRTRAAAGQDSRS